MKLVTNKSYLFFFALMSLLLAAAYNHKLTQKSAMGQEELPEIGMNKTGGDFNQEFRSQVRAETRVDPDSVVDGISIRA